MTASQIHLADVPQSQIDVLVVIFRWLWGEEKLVFWSTGATEEEETEAQKYMEFWNREAEAALDRVANKRQLKDWAYHARNWSQTEEKSGPWGEICYSVRMSNFEFRKQCRELEQSLKALLKVATKQVEVAA